MDFDKLIEPYTENGRSVKGQILWLQRKGYSPVIIEKVIQSVYSRLAGGETFENGHELDQELKRVADSLQGQEAELLLKNMDRLLEGGRFKKAWKALRGKL